MALWGVLQCGHQKNASAEPNKTHAMNVRQDKEKSTICQVKRRKKVGNWDIKQTTTCDQQQAPGDSTL